MTDKPFAIVKTDVSAIERETGTILDALSRAAADPNVDVGKLERLLSMQKEILADQRRQSYMAALARLQERMPQINKAGVITDRDGLVRNRYAKLEDIDATVRPMCAEEGFSFTFDSKRADGGIEFTCDMHHRDGHTERKAIVLPVDNGAGRNSVQAVGSTTSYARRYLLSMHLNLVTRDEDDDGKGGREPITPEQVIELKTKLSDVGGNEARFLNWIAAATFEEIPASNYKRALGFIAEKKRQGSR